MTDKLIKTTALKNIIDYSLNFVIEGHYKGMDKNHLGRCADYAVIGARVLNELLDNSYTAVSGGGATDCGNGRILVLSPGRKARRNARTLGELREYHCWIQSVDAVREGKPCLEIVDFTLRQDEEVAKFFDVEFTRSMDKTYLWAWHDEVMEAPPELQKHFDQTGKFLGWWWEFDFCTALLRKYEDEYSDIFDQLTPFVLDAVNILNERYALEQAGHNPQALQTKSTGELEKLLKAI